MVSKTLSELFEEVKINYLHKLFGFGSDGAFISSREKKGIKTILQREIMWFNFGCCVAHRLELALKGAFKGMPFADTEELLPRLRYLYKRSPKKLRQPKHKKFDFSHGGYYSKNCQLISYFRKYFMLSFFKLKLIKNLAILNFFYV